MTKYQLLHGDCLDKLKELEDNSVDAIVTDPPYGLSFMGKKWDYDVPSQEIWEECFRVLKQGGHLLSFSGSRTYHRMAVRIEDAGFEIRDQIMWIYGSGFPKSHNIGKAVDKIGGENISWFIDYVLNIIEERGITMQDMTKLMPSKTGKTTGWWYNKAKYKSQGLTLEQFNLIKNALNLPFDDLEETKREVLGKLKTNVSVMQNIGGDYKSGEIEVTKGNSEWEGWGTALKPAHEPIVMARKPFKGSVADNVLEHGVGGINIDGCRVDFQDTQNDINPSGRFPANIIFDEEAGKILDKQSVGASRFFYCPKASKKDRNEGCDELEEKEQAHSTNMRCGNCNKLILSGNGDSCKCENKLEVRHKAKNHHPTIKPTNLMAYLVRLVTPKGGVVLDPFMGSGSTGKACAVEGMQFIGIEREQEYLDIAKARIEHAYNPTNPKLF